MRACLFIVFPFVLILVACNSNEIGGSKDVSPESIYFDYQVTGQENMDQAAVRLQYRFAGPNGTTLFLEDPCKVELDGKLIHADSSRITGAYYATDEPITTFAGKHTIVFTDMNKKQYREDFEYYPVSLKTEIPDSITRDNLVFELEGLRKEDFVRIVMTDTAFASEEINRVDTIRDGKVMISKDDLRSLVNGPIQLELTREEERPVKHGTKEGGLILISYRLTRNFTLKD